MTAQLPTASPDELGRWLVCAVAALVIFRLAKSLFYPALPRRDEFVTRGELEDRVAKIEKDIKDVQGQVQVIHDGQEALKTETVRSMERVTVTLEYLARRVEESK